MSRGRLIFPLLVDIAQLDTAATDADPDGAGPLLSGYSDIFREPEIVAPASGSARGTDARVEVTIQLRAQIEPVSYERLQMLGTGNSPTSQISLIFHYADLEAAGMVDLSTGRPLLRSPGDRLAAVRKLRSGDLIEQFPAVPGLYAVSVQSRGFGLGGDRNLLQVTFEERQRAVGS